MMTEEEVEEDAVVQALVHFSPRPTDNDEPSPAVRGGESAAAVSPSGEAVKSPSVGSSLSSGGGGGCISPSAQIVGAATADLSPHDGEAGGGCSELSSPLECNNKFILSEPRHTM